MNKKDIDFTKVSISADEFDAMMRQALDALSPVEEPAKAGKRTGKKAKAAKAKRHKTDKTH